MTGQEYVEKVLAEVKKKNSGEIEFYEAVKEVLQSIAPVFEKNPEFIRARLLERMVEPERIITFRVPWVDDQGEIQINRGFRIQFNSALGPYKGGLRFHPTVNQSIMKFLGFEQTLKNSLTGLPIGGAKGGSDFNPRGRSEHEVMKFCQSFMAELYKYIGADVDVPAGDIGVGSREIGYLYGYYKKLQGTSAQGVLTGKGISYGGSLGRTQATGFGLVYFAEEMLKDKGLTIKDKTVVVSGSGNVAIYAIEKAQCLGARVIACSDSNGYVVDEKGIDVAVVKEIKELKRGRIKEYADIVPGAQYVEGSGGIWNLKCEVALPCATQSEIDEKAAETLVRNGVLAVAEGANMPSSFDAIAIFIKAGILFGPSKAANAAGVACSALEMSQNSMRYSWTFDEVEQKLKVIMRGIYKNAKKAAREYGAEGNLVVGANITGFLKVAAAMMDQGLV